MRFARQLPPLDTLVSFEAVARLGSYTAAAEELCVTQSAVSKQMRMLERHLDLTLFLRHARGVELNAVGLQLLHTVQPTLHSLAGTIDKLRQEQHANRVSVVATHAVAHHWLFTKLTEFNQSHPDIRVSIHSINEISAEIVADYDFGILYGTGQWSGLDASPLFPERIYPVCHSDYDVIQPESVTLLSSYPLIQLDSRAWNCLSWSDWFNHFDIQYRPPADSISFNQVTLAYNAALKGLGIALGWEFMVAKDVEKGLLKPVGSFVYETGKFDYLVHQSHRPLSDAALLFKRWLVSTL